METERIKTFVKSPEYKEFKDFMLLEFCDTPVKIKTDKMSNEMIALEYKASELACKKLLKGIKKFERLAGMGLRKPEPYR